MPDCDEEKKFEEEIRDRRNSTPEVTLCPTGDELTSPPPEELTSPSQEVTPPKVPDELKEPPQTPVPPEPEVDFMLPGPIEVYNSGYTAECTKEGTEGDEVYVEEGAFKAPFYFSTVLSLSDEVLDYIARHHLEDNIEKLIHEHRLTAEVLRALTGMTLSQAKEFISAAYALQEQQDDYARGYAEAQLVCLYRNKEVTVECEDEEMAHDGEYEGAVFSYTVPERMFSSAYSQEDADRKAREFAAGMLNCFYVNDEVEADCLTWPGRPTDYTEPIPNDEEEVYPGKGKRVGHVSVAPGMFTSRLSKEDANERARALAYTMLSCWYPNDPVHIECEDEDARNLGVNPEEVPRQEADLDHRGKGQIVDIPEGYFTSDISREEATERAQLLASELLECCYINDPYVLECEPQEVTYPDNEVKELCPPEEGMGVLRVEVRAGEFTSCNSKEEANTFARTSVEGMLDCFYCNREIPPTCVPDWVLEGVREKKIDLPLTGPVITDGKHTISLSDLPPEATRGARAKAFCTNDAQVSVNVAYAGASVPVHGSGEDCIYVNDAVYATCSGVDPFTGEEHEAGKVHYLTHPETGEAYLFYTRYPSDACLSQMWTRPLLGEEYSVVPAGMFAIPGDDEKEECNARALDLALSVLFCVFTNPQTIGICNSEDIAFDLCDSSWTIGNGTSDDPGQLVDWANTVNNPVVLPAGYIQFIGTGAEDEDPFGEIFGAVKSTVSSMILCIYTNVRQEVDCNDLPEGPVREERLDSCGSMKYVTNGSTGVIEAGTIYADSSEEANATAYSLAYSMATCNINTVYVWCQSFFMPFSSPPSSPGSPSPIPTTPFDHWPLPVPPGGGGAGGSASENVWQDCCYPDCPLYRQGKKNIMREVTDISDLEEKVTTVLTGSTDKLQEMEKKAIMLENYIDTLLKQIETDA